LGCGGIGREDVTTECVGGTTVCFGNATSGSFRLTERCGNRASAYSSTGQGGGKQPTVMVAASCRTK